MIRSATAADNAAVFRLCQQLDMVNPPADRDDFDVTFYTILGSRGVGRDVLLVSEDDSARVTGYAYLTVSRLLYAGGLSGHLEELVVDSSARGAGTGSALVRACERVCADRGVGQLTMSTRRAGAFYSRLGYERTAEFYKKRFR
ncbi:GNAT family N-acetyltransferase [Planctomonas psychrotolerans]|uniref:GNAT family N-acetyltransferase n=1 Tax=Planctomonas psychrotolerans TaxID=2528712 RepID=UPI0012388381|nr:GNAT family N-acetyltransferase [Planctomonas psychrotolerans]